MMFQPLGKQWWLYEKTHCFNGGWNPRGLLHQQSQRTIFLIQEYRDI